MRSILTKHLNSMISQLAFYPVLGLPAVAWGGMATLISLLTTATLGYLFHTGRARFPFRWHPIAAITTITLGVIHGTIVMLAFLGF